MGFGRKKYIGGFSDQDEAARVYDKYTLFAKGTAAKTNFSYTAADLEIFLNIPVDFDESLA